jgi:hypothetical protein
LNPAELQLTLKEFIMIHHLARAFSVREQLREQASLSQRQAQSLAQRIEPEMGLMAVAQVSAAPQPSTHAHASLEGGQHSPRQPQPAPVKPRPITPWSAPSRPTPQRSETLERLSAKVLPLSLRLRRGGASLATARPVRICTDPSDARRTVIAGRFAEVCAALDRLVMEQEAVA